MYPYNIQDLALLFYVPAKCLFGLADLFGNEFPVPEMQFKHRISVYFYMIINLKAIKAICLTTKVKEPLCGDSLR